MLFYAFELMLYPTLFVLFGVDSKLDSPFLNAFELLFGLLLILTIELLCPT
jgi:hypothetical protein